MGDILTGIVKGLSGFMPQDDPDVKIFNAQTEMRELAEKEEKAYGRLGRQVYKDGASGAYPELKTELDLLEARRQEAERCLQEARNEKEARERKEAEKTVNTCPNCGEHNPEGTNFCQECGTKLTVPRMTAANRFCPDCGAEVPNGSHFCGSCGSKFAE